jgi:hypothetical protein
MIPSGVESSKREPLAFTQENHMAFLSVVASVIIVSSVIWLIMRPSCSALRRFLIVGEELEPRWVPDTYRWAPLLKSDDNWSTQYVIEGITNWQHKIGPTWWRATSLPDADDTVIFDGSVDNR